MPRLSRLLAFCLLCVAAATPPAWATDYPTHPVKWVVPYPPGGTTDVLARIIAQWLTDKMGQHSSIENKPGGGNNIGTEIVVNAPPDGYTMLLVNPANGINATLYKNLSFNFIRDIAPVAGIVRTPNVMEVTTDPFRRRPSRSSSPTARPTRARSTWPRRAAAPRCTFRASCSSP